MFGMYKKWKFCLRVCCGIKFTSLACIWTSKFYEPSFETNISLNCWGMMILMQLSLTLLCGNWLSMLWTNVFGIARLIYKIFELAWKKNTEKYVNSIFKWDSKCSTFLSSSIDRLYNFVRLPKGSHILS